MTECTIRLRRSVKGWSSYLIVGISFLGFELGTSSVASAASQMGYYQVRRGDILSQLVASRQKKLGLTQRIYGSQGLLRQVIRLNRGRIKKANQIEPGTWIRFPPRLRCSALGDRVFLKKKKHKNRRAKKVYADPQATLLPPPENFKPLSNETHGRESQIDWGIGVAVLGSTVRAPAFPQVYLSGQFSLGKTWEIRPFLMGLPVTQLGSGSSSVADAQHIQTQVRLAAGSWWGNHVFLGLGLRSFAFGITQSDQLSRQASIEGVGLWGYTLPLSQVIRLSGWLEPRLTTAIWSQNGKWTPRMQWGGLGIFTQIRYQVSSQVDCGLYGSLDWVRLRWNRDSQAYRFQTYQLGIGAQLGVRF